jgi:hypothetical protein
MRSPGQGAARVARGTLLALCCTVLALSGHVLGGGEVVAVLPMLVVAGPLAAAFVVWADRERRPAELAAAGAGSQVAFHLVFSLCGGTGLPSAVTPAAVQMAAGHVVAGVVMTWVLARGEAALWRLHRALSRVLRLRVVRLPVVESGPSRPPQAAWPQERGTGLVLAAAHQRRGPPRALAA